MGGLILSDPEVEMLCKALLTLGQTILDDAESGALDKDPDDVARVCERLGDLAARLVSHTLGFSVLDRRDIRFALDNYIGRSAPDAYAYRILRNRLFPPNT